MVRIFILYISQYNGIRKKPGNAYNPKCEIQNVVIFNLRNQNSNDNIKGCPDRCECSLAKCSFGTGTSSVCVWRGLKNVPMGLPNGTCAV